VRDPTSLAALLFVFNTGQLTAEKTKLVNTADAVAYSAAVMQARALNFDAYTNRALMADEVMIAQAVSIAAWSARVVRHMENMTPRNCRSYYSVPAAPVLIDYIPVCYLLSLPTATWPSSTASQPATCCRQWPRRKCISSDRAGATMSKRNCPACSIPTGKCASRPPRRPIWLPPQHWEARDEAVWPVLCHRSPRLQPDGSAHRHGQPVIEPGHVGSRLAGKDGARPLRCHGACARRVAIVRQAASSRP